jgi:hypothetical protein
MGAMARMLLEALSPGMKLSKPICNVNGLLLLRAGEVLTAKHLAIFKTWGIREADVVRDDAAEPEATAEILASPEVLAAAEREIARRFRRADVAKDPVMADLKRVAMKRLVVRLTSQAAGTDGRQGE